MTTKSCTKPKAHFEARRRWRKKAQLFEMYWEFLSVLNFGGVRKRAERAKRKGKREREKQSASDMCASCSLVPLPGQTLFTRNMLLLLCNRFMFSISFIYSLRFSLDFHLFICVLYECVHNKCYLFLLNSLHSIPRYFIHLKSARIRQPICTKLRANSIDLNSTPINFFSP